MLSRNRNLFLSDYTSTKPSQHSNDLAIESKTSISPPALADSRISSGNGTYSCSSSCDDDGGGDNQQINALPAITPPQLQRTNSSEVRKWRDAMLGGSSVGENGDGNANVGNVMSMKKEQLEKVQVKDRAKFVKKQMQVYGIVNPTVKGLKKYQKQQKTTMNKMKLEPILISKIKELCSNQLQQQNERHEALELETNIDNEKYFNQLNQSMERIGKNLPVEFLIRGNHKSIAITINMQTIYRKLHQHHLCIIRISLQRWVQHRLAMQQIEFAIRSARLAEQTALFHVCNLIRSHIHHNMRRLVHTWQYNTIQLRTIEHNECALQIQCRYKCYRAQNERYRLQQARDWKLCQTAAITIQKYTRRYFVQLLFHSLKEQQLLDQSAMCLKRFLKHSVIQIQKYRQYQWQCCLRIQTKYRQYQAKVVRKMRREAFACVAMQIVTHAILSAAEERVVQIVLRIVAFQNTFFRYQFRQSAHWHSQILHKRLRYFPAMKIQRAWQQYHEYTIQTILNQVSFIISYRIQQYCKTFQLRCQQSKYNRYYDASVVIQTMLRGVKTRHVMKARCLIYLDYLLNYYMQNYPKRILGAAVYSFLRLPCEIETCHQSIKYITRVKQFIQLQRVNCVIQLQCLYRGYLARTYTHRQRQAWQVLSTLFVSELYKYVKWKRRQRVLYKWRHKRKLVLGKSFCGLRALIQAMKATTLVQTSKYNNSKAYYHYRHTQLRTYSKHWTRYLQIQAHQRIQTGIARAHYRHHVKQISTQQWQQYRHTQAVQYTVFKVQFQLAVFQEWHQYARKLVQSHTILARINQRKQSICMHKLQLQYMVSILHDGIAIQHRNQLFQRRYFRALKQYCKLQTQIQSMYAYNNWKYTVNVWIGYQCQRVKALEDCKRANRLIVKRNFRQWLKIKAILADIAARNRKIAAFALEQAYKRSILHWYYRVDCLKEMAILDKQGRKHFNRKICMYTLKDWIVLWNETVGLKKIQASVYIQKLWRGKLARRLYADMKAMHEYKMSMRIKYSLDAHNMTNTEFEEAIAKYDWNFIYFYYPWEPPSKELYTEVAKVGTFFTTERHVKMGFCDATQIHSKTRMSLAMTYQIDKAIPFMCTFWQQRTKYSTTLKHRFKYVNLGVNLTTTPPPITSSSTVIKSILMLFDTSKQFTAIDLQAFARNYLFKLRKYDQLMALRLAKAIKIQRWYRYESNRYSTKRHNRNAMQIQRWWRLRKCQIEQLRQFHLHLVELKKPILRIQRCLRWYYRKRQIQQHLIRKYATVQKYPNAVLCSYCMNSETFNIAIYKCEQCVHHSSCTLDEDLQAIIKQIRIVYMMEKVYTERFTNTTGTDATGMTATSTTTTAAIDAKLVPYSVPYCLKCYEHVHLRGHRAHHTNSLIDIVSMNRNLVLCDYCQVQIYMKVCMDCKKCYCFHCFEQAHLPFSSTCLHVGIHKRSKQYKLYMKKKSKRTKLKHCMTTSSLFIVQNRWETHTRIQKKMRTIEKQILLQEQYEFALQQTVQAMKDEVYKIWQQYDTQHTGSLGIESLKCMLIKDFIEPFTLKDVYKCMKDIGTVVVTTVPHTTTITDTTIDTTTTTTSTTNPTDTSRGNNIAPTATTTLNNNSNTVTATVTTSVAISTDNDAENTAINSAIAVTTGSNRVRREDVIYWISNAMVQRKHYKLKQIVRAWRKQNRQIQSIQANVNSFVSTYVPTRPRCKSKVPKYHEIDQIGKKDYTAKKLHFVRYIQENYNLPYISTDIEDVDMKKQMYIYEHIFIPKWNGGILGAEYYYDQYEFQYESDVYREVWDTEKKKYYFVNTTTQECLQIDPRKRQQLYTQANEAFQEIDKDGSGTINVDEFYQLMTSNLCEPMSYEAIVKIMDEIDSDGNGYIEFDEFYQWFGSENSQPYQQSLKANSLKLALRARKNASRAAKVAFESGVRGGTEARRIITEKLAKRKFEQDSKGATPEMILLLKEGFDKKLCEKALLLHENDATKAKEYLYQKQEEEDYLLAEKLKLRKQKREYQKEMLRNIKNNAKAHFVHTAKSFKQLVSGQKRTHNENVNFLINNLIQDMDDAEDYLEKNVK